MYSVCALCAEFNRNELVEHGALPILVSVLESSDHDVQYYCAAALSNMAVNEKHRALVVAIGHFDCLHRLIALLASSKDKVSDWLTALSIIALLASSKDKVSG